MDEFQNNVADMDSSGREQHPDGFKPMTTFDKACAVLAIPIGVIFMVLGAIGLFTGAKAHFALPPILGGLPFFLGWAMSIPLIRYWRISNKRRMS
ncbi:MAG: hypothetical protein JSU94_09570 [Phycisphaerales bacterium]|nr:MAG: hypothetical protein JSW59_11125 [Phycisphaerales bacterium]UCG50017.1 MAG: hypothetical protein JSU94_09570 [Phycisphaerales bacterium]